jgi:hypothetical protein
MSVLWWVVLGLLAWRLAAWRRRRHRQPDLADDRLRRRPRRAHRLGDRRRRRAAADEARALVTRLASDVPVQGVELAAGVVLQAGELAWLRSTTHLSVWVGKALWVTSSRSSWLGRRAESVGASRVRAGWRDEGSVDWLVTSARLVGRRSRTGELLSIPWASILGLEVDLGAGVVRIQTANGRRCVLSGAGVAPIAVAGIAACHGVAALPEHPALAGLREPALSTDPASTRRPEPLALGRGESEQLRPPKLPRR